MALTGKQRRYLRGLGHSLTPVVHVGKDGITVEVIGALDQALATHELIKVRIGQNALVERQDAAAEMAASTGSEVAQVLGNTVLLYRPDPKDPQIVLPPAAAAFDETDDAEPEPD